MDGSKIIGRVFFLDGEAGVEDLAYLSVVGDSVRCGLWRRRFEVVEKRQGL